MNKPDWKKGDIIVMPMDLWKRYCKDPVRSGGIYNGCSVFVADHDPCDTLPNGGHTGNYYYAWEDARCFRKATVEDVDRLILIQSKTVIREASRFHMLLDVRRRAKKT